MVVVSSCREMLGQVPQRAQPLSIVASSKMGTLWRLPGITRRKVGMTSNHHAPYDLGTCYNGVNKGTRAREGEQTSEITSQFGLQSATRLHEAGIASNRESACRGEYVPGSCTHRPSHHGSQQRPKSVTQPFRRELPKAGRITGVKS